MIAANISSDYFLSHIPPHSQFRTMIEITTKCNLHCTYCLTNVPDWRAETIDFQKVQRMTNFLHDSGSRILTVSGHGETTVVEGWEELCEELIERGFALRINSNLARPFTDKMVSVLARFDTINISLDTIDAGLLRRTRRFARLETILKNIDAIRGWCSQHNFATPKFQILAVVSDMTLAGIPALADFVIEKALYGLQLYGLVESADLKYDNSTPRSIAFLPKTILLEQSDRFRDAVEKAKKAKLDVYVTADLSHIFDTARLSLAQHSSSRIEDMPKPGPQNKAEQYIKGPQTDQTRFCQDPWDMFYLKTNGDIFPCCGGFDAIGNVDDIDDAFPNTQKAITLRENLLSGNLSEICRSCGQKPVVSLIDFRDYITNYLLQICAQHIPNQTEAFPYRIAGVICQCLRDGVRRVFLFGAGSHTKALLQDWNNQGGLPISGLLVTKPNAINKLMGLPLMHAEAFIPSPGDGIVLSSKSFETEMAAFCRSHWPNTRYYPLYHIRE